MALMIFLPLPISQLKGFALDSQSQDSYNPTAHTQGSQGVCAHVKNILKLLNAWFLPKNTPV